MLSYPLFPIDFCHVQNTIPPPEPTPSATVAHACTQSLLIIADIQRLECYFVETFQASAPSATPHLVSFDLNTSTSSDHTRNMHWDITPPSTTRVDHISDALSGGTVRQHSWFVTVSCIVCIVIALFWAYLCTMPFIQVKITFNFIVFI
jgi:hypothetical protein